MLGNLRERAKRRHASSLDVSAGANTRTRHDARLAEGRRRDVEHAAVFLRDQLRLERDARQHVEREVLRRVEPLDDVVYGVNVSPATSFSTKATSL